MNMKQIILIFLGNVMLLSQCINGGKSRRISYYNNSVNPISECWSYCYPDTLLPVIKPVSFVPINKEMHTSFGDLGYQEDHLFASLPADTLSIFIFDYDIIERYDWQTIRDNYTILVRYDFSQKDLQKLKWCIYYPPTEEMKDMKMFPPYGSD